MIRLVSEKKVVLHFFLFGEEICEKMSRGGVRWILFFLRAIFVCCSCREGVCVLDARKNAIDGDKFAIASPNIDLGGMQDTKCETAANADRLASKYGSWTFTRHFAATAWIAEKLQDASLCSRMLATNGVQEENRKHVE